MKRADLLISKITGSGRKIVVERIDIPHETPAGNTAEQRKRKTNSTQKQNNLTHPFTIT